MDEATARRRLYRLGAERYRDRLMLAWARSGGDGDGAQWHELATLPERWSAPKFPLKAADFIARGIAEGPALGQVLALAEDAWLAAEFPLDEAALKAIADQAVARYTRDHTPVNILSSFADISLLQLLLVAGVALFASVIGGLAGYGTGALMPLVLVPLLGAEPVVPIIAISAIFTNLSRMAAYLRYTDRRRALIVILAGALSTALGAYGYTRLTNSGAALVIGAMLISSVPLRRLARRRDIRIGDAGLGLSAVGYGVVVGGTSGSGVILLSLLMAAGLQGAAVIATDAVISVVTSLIKISVFGLAGVVTAQVLAFAILIGAISFPGAFFARAFVERMPVHIHTAILDVAVIDGRRGDDVVGAAEFLLKRGQGRYGAAGQRNPAARQANSSRNFALLGFVLFFVIVVLFLVIRLLDFGEFEHGRRQRFAKQRAVIAHPEALDRLVADFRHRQRMASGFQNHDIARLQIHDLFLQID